MSGYLLAAHIWAAACSFGVAGFLFAAGTSVDIRFLIGPSERERAYNFQVVSLFLFFLGLDMAAAPFGIADAPHFAAITFACIAGTIALSMFVWRVCKWKP